MHTFCQAYTAQDIKVDFLEVFNLKNVKLFTDNIRLTAIGYPSVSSDLKTCLLHV